MRWAFPAVLLATQLAAAQERFVARTPLPHHPPAHTMERAGNPQRIAPWAVPGISRYSAGGYVGGACLKGNSAFCKGPVLATGPLATGTFGWDFAGFKLHSGRVFLAPSADPSAGSPIARNYRADGPHVPDVVSLRPFRRAVLEKREVMEERKCAGER